MIDVYWKGLWGIVRSTRGEPRHTGSDDRSSLSFKGNAVVYIHPRDPARHKVLAHFL